MGKLKRFLIWVKKHDKLLIQGATWFLVIAAFLGTYLAWRGNEKQVAELKEATRLQWRPFLEIDFEDALFGVAALKFNTKGTDSTSLRVDTLYRPMNEQFDTTQLFAGEVSGYMFSYPRILKYTNVGATPLRVTHTYNSVLTKQDWINKYGKNPVALYKSILSSGKLFPFQVDYVVKPDETKHSHRPVAAATEISTSELREYLFTDSCFTAYPFTIVVYEDMFGNKYNSLLMDYSIADVIYDSTTIRVDSITRIVGTEILRWDIGEE